MLLSQHGSRGKPILSQLLSRPLIGSYPNYIDSAATMAEFLDKETLLKLGEPDPEVIAVSVLTIWEGIADAHAKSTWIANRRRI